LKAAQLCAAAVGFALLTLAIALGAGNAHGKDLVPSAPPFQGQVLDAATQQPIPGAMVMVMAVGYSASFSMHSGHRPLWRYAVPAAADGRFSSPGWTWSKGRPIAFDEWNLHIFAYAPGYEFLDREKNFAVIVPIKRARTLGVFPTDELAHPKPVRILLRRSTSTEPDDRSKVITLLLSLYRGDWEADRPGDPLVYEVLGTEVRALQADPRLSGSRHQSLETLYRQLQIDIEGPRAYPAPRRTERAKRAEDGSAAAPAR
jgi:hypothetical protein